MSSDQRTSGRKRRQERSRSREHSSRRRSRERSRERSGERSGERARERTRERSRTVRPRSRSGSYRIERSVSRDLFKGEEAPQAVQKLVESQQELLYQWLKEHKEEVDEKLQVKARRFNSKPIERQYQLNSGYKEQVSKILAALEAGEVNRARDLAESLEGQLTQHEEDLIIADTSPHGWLAVARLRRGSELPKALRKRLDQVEKELSSQKKDGGSFKKKFGQVQREDKQPLVKRQDRRLSPEEVLYQASKQLRPGTCTHCNKGLHYFRECPAFWEKVQESRRAKAKEQDAD